MGGKPPTVQLGVSHAAGSYWNHEPFTVDVALGRRGRTFKGLVDTGASGGNFIDKKVAQQLYDDDEQGIGIIELPHPRRVRGYDGRRGPDITHGM